jgi:magnesium-transporting ATPase (P-type)
LRDGVKDAVTKCTEGGTNIRIISGDHRDTVMYFAQQIYEEWGEMSGEDLSAQLYELME